MDGPLLILAVGPAAIAFVMRHDLMPTALQALGPWE